MVNLTKICSTIIQSGGCGWHDVTYILLLLLLTGQAWLNPIWSYSYGDFEWTPRRIDIFHAELARGGLFLRWLSAKLLGDIYPGAPNERKVFATLLLNNLLELWSYNGDLNPGRLQRRELQKQSSQPHGIEGLEFVAPDMAQPTFSLAILGKAPSAVRPVGVQRRQSLWQ
jgi:hypothetical protein